MQLRGNLLQTNIDEKSSWPGFTSDLPSQVQASQPKRPETIRGLLLSWLVIESLECSPFPVDNEKKSVCELNL